jgi:hypothetical protein
MPIINLLTYLPTYMYYIFNQLYIYYQPQTSLSPSYLHPTHLLPRYILITNLHIIYMPTYPLLTNMPT